VCVRDMIGIYSMYLHIKTKMYLCIDFKNTISLRIVTLSASTRLQLPFRVNLMVKGLNAFLALGRLL